MLKIKMPIGVPRIIYCWGEELPAQWTDIYNFIFRRRMVFLMQYLDDELCNQICGLLINIHMEDRSKELEKKEMERSGVFSKTPASSSNSDVTKSMQGSSEATTTSPTLYNKKLRSMQDLLNADEDLGIDDVHTLEQRTLQKITTEWLNWNAQFFHYSDEPYLFYLAELLSKDFNKSQQNVGLNQNSLHSEISQLLTLLKNTNISKNTQSVNALAQSVFNNKASLQMGEVYSPFRTKSITNRNLSTNMKHNHDFMNAKKQALLQLLQQYNHKGETSSWRHNLARTPKMQKTIENLLSNLAQKDFTGKLADFDVTQKQQRQKNLRSSFCVEKNFQTTALKETALTQSQFQFNFNNNISSHNYLNSGADLPSSSDFRLYYGKQTERTLLEEESKKVFVVINSFGGSVGNGITVHDALQFIKAGSLTLALGVAASAASLALAGGTIGERYVTEGCHVMIHQPEGGLTGQASDIWIDSQEIMKIRLDVAEIYSLSTYRPRHKILRDLDRDFYLTASETIQYGLADEIATNEVMHVILEETNRAWNYDDSKQQRLLESRESASSGVNTQTQN